MTLVLCNTNLFKNPSYWCFIYFWKFRVHIVFLWILYVILCLIFTRSLCPNIGLFIFPMLINTSRTIRRSEWSLVLERLISFQNKNKDVKFILTFFIRSPPEFKNLSKFKSHWYIKSNVNNKTVLIHTYYLIYQGNLLFLEILLL